MMKIKCDGCDREEAQVFCCADEAPLCLGCDEKIHAANKIVTNHHRILLSSTSSSLPRSKCDICQETFGYFFCLEDRALLCRKCDVAIHTRNSFVSRHQRFLLTGVKVGLEPTLSADKVKAKGDSLAADLPPVAATSQKCYPVAASEVPGDTENTRTGSNPLATSLPQVVASSQEANLVAASEVAMNTETTWTRGDFLAANLSQITTSNQEGNPVAASDVVIDTKNARTWGDFLVADRPQVATSSQKGHSLAASEVVVNTENAAITGSQNGNILDFICSSPNNPPSQDVLSKGEGEVHGNLEWWNIIGSTEEEAAES